MISYRLTDKQASSTATSLMMAPFVVVFLALKIAERGRTAFAVGFVIMMAVLLSGVLIQVSQSRRLNAADREKVHG